MEVHYSVYKHDSFVVANLGSVATKCSKMVLDFFPSIILRNGLTTMFLTLFLNSGGGSFFSHCILHGLDRSW